MAACIFATSQGMNCCPRIAQIPNLPGRRRATPLGRLRCIPRPGLSSARAASQRARPHEAARLGKVKPPVRSWSTPTALSYRSSASPPANTERVHSQAMRALRPWRQARPRSPQVSGTNRCREHCHPCAKEGPDTERRVAAALYRHIMLQRLLPPHSPCRCTRPLACKFKCFDSPALAPVTLLQAGVRPPLYDPIVQ